MSLVSTNISILIQINPTTYALWGLFFILWLNSVYQRYIAKINDGRLKYAITLRTG